MQATVERLTFPGGNGATLAARLERPRHGPMRAVALFAHCFTCTKDSHAATRIAGRLAELGIATLRFDFTGLGGSGGDFASSHFSANVADLVAAADYLRETVGPPAILIGHSLGGAAVIAAAHRVPDARAVVTLAAPFDTAHVLKTIGGDVEAVERAGEGTVDIAGRRFSITRGFIEDARDQRQGPRLAALDRALLVMHAPRDEIVGIANARAIFEAARHPKSYISLDDADHLLTRPADSAYAAAMIAAWVEPYLPPAAAGTDVPHGTVVVETAGGKFTQTVTAGPHRFLADEPEAQEGDDLGPNPYEFLLTALGTCTVMTLQFYARREGIPLDAARAVLTYQREPSPDAATPDTGLKTVDVLERTITLTGDLTPEQRQDLIRVANKCPVHKTLTSKIVVRTVEG